MKIVLAYMTYKNILNSRGLALVLSVFFLVLTSGCAADRHQSTGDETSLTADKLAKDWRSNVRNNPSNPFEGGGYPTDNDVEYYVPKKKAAPQQRNYNSYPDDDSYYGKYPRYNPDDDNKPYSSKTIQDIWNS